MISSHLGILTKAKEDGYDTREYEESVSLNFKGLIHSKMEIFSSLPPNPMWLSFFYGAQKNFFLAECPSCSFI